MHPTFKQIRYFIAVADAEQVSKASMDINVSQSAITTAIKQLEEMLGTTLFERHKSGVTLTYEGNLFLEHALHIVQSVEEAVRIPKRVKDDVRGHINLAVTYTVAGYFLPRLLAQFIRVFPNIVVNICEADRNTIEEGLVTGEFDLAVMLTSNIVNHEELVNSLLLRSKRRLWAGTNHPILTQTPITLQRISEQPYIMLAVDEASNTAQRYWRKTPYKPQTIFRTTSVEAVRSMVAGGMGVCILSDMVYRPWSLEGRRVEVRDVADQIPTMDVGLAWAADKELIEATQAFIDFIKLSIGTEQFPNE